MMLKITSTPEIKKGISLIYLIKNAHDLKKSAFSEVELEYIKTQTEKNKKSIQINSYSHWSYIQVLEEEKEDYKTHEKLRRAAGTLYSTLKENKHSEIILVDLSNNASYIKAFTEGLALSHYQFLKYFTKQDEKINTLKEIFIYSDKITNEEIKHVSVITEAVYKVKDLVNEPVSFLNTETFCAEIRKLGQQSNFDVEILNKKQIEALKMNGLLAVNKGSIDPPAFSILTWKPKNAKNTKPFILVGKGIVYDTGGLNIKTGNYLDDMKSDMAGGAAVAGTIFALAKLKLPIYIIGLIPITDNRLNGNSLAPDDIISMHNGTTVEVKNTDAEGRLILADALSFAQKYNPELVIDIATLTGSAQVAISNLGMVGMSNCSNDYFEKLKSSGNNVYERIVEFPVWDEYNEMLKSDIADIKNIGGREAGAITAAKFLQHFTDYNWIHLDIAGCAFLNKPDNYRGNGATGVTVRLLYDFFMNQI